MTAYTPLKILAEDSDDLQVIAACLQDALVPLSGMDYDKEGGHFHLIANRFCWECDPELCEGNPYYARVAAGLAFHHVKDVQKKDIQSQSKTEMVNLLTICHVEEGCIHLIFSGGAEIKLTVDRVSCHLKDVDEPYVTPNKPCHER